VLAILPIVGRWPLAWQFDEPGAGSDGLFMRFAAQQEARSYAATSKSASRALRRRA
jgi:hypothetical protein